MLIDDFKSEVVKKEIDNLVKTCGLDHRNIGIMLQ